jgi:hypothetical protein
VQITDLFFIQMFSPRNSLTPLNGLRKSMNCRYFSAQQAAAALRPFYFAVHPDRFARDPVVRSKNEKALQVFNGYLNDLYPNNRNQQPVKVVFSVMKDKGRLEDISITLTGADPHELVETALKKLNLSTKDLPPRSTASFYDSPTNPSTSSDIKSDLDDLWAKMQEREVRTRKKKVVYIKPNDLFANLVKNRESAIERTITHTKMTEMLQDEIEYIISKTKATKVIWGMNWDQKFMRRCLSNIHQMIAQASEENKATILAAINGHKLIFGRGSFICCDGSLQFGADDVPEKWQKVCLEAAVRRKEAKNFIQLCDHVQELFGGAKLFIDPHENLLKAIGQLQSIIVKISTKSKGEVIEVQRLAKNTIIEISSVYGELAILRDGRLQIPCNVDFGALVDFLKTTAQKSRDIKGSSEKQTSGIEESATNVKKALNLKNLTWESGLSQEILAETFEKLQKVDESVQSLINGLSIHISANPNIFVMTDGRISIPTNWV